MDKKTALIVIDMQRGFLDESSPCYIAGAQATVPACAAVIAECRPARHTGLFCHPALSGGWQRCRAYPA